MSTTTTPNMNLVVPGVSTEPGPAWAQEINADLGILDQHNHSPGQGVQITPSGLNINTDLSFNQNNITDLKTINFAAQSAPLAGTAPNLGCLYVAGNELVYNDENGNVVPITNNGSVNAGAGSITGLPSGTASATFSSGTFIWQQSTNTAATMDGGPVIIRNTTASSPGVTLQPISGLATNYSLTLPIIPGAASALAIDAVGNISPITTSSNIGSASANAIANARTRSTGTTVGIGGVAISASCNSFGLSFTGSPTVVTNLSVTITTSGRPVMILLQTDGTTSQSGITINEGSATTTNALEGKIYLFNGTSFISTQDLDFFTTITATTTSGTTPPQAFSVLSTTTIDINQISMGIPLPSMSYVDVVAAGTYTYSIYAELITGQSMSVDHAKLVAYEL